LNKTFRSLVGHAGHFENIDFVERDARNYIGQQRRVFRKEGHGQALMVHFSRMREFNNEFYYEIDTDADNRIINVFWADARSRASLVDFGDVVSFDTTYLTNKYHMLFAPFVGVNHHGQSILLGCGLLSSEDTSTFSLLFRCWLRCIGNRAPDRIINDQCKTMKNAIAIVFPNTRHQLCFWHIMKKVLEILGGLTSYKTLKHGLKQLVYESTSSIDFELGWEQFISKFIL